MPIAATNGLMRPQRRYNPPPRCNPRSTPKKLRPVSPAQAMGAEASRCAWERFTDRKLRQQWRFSTMHAKGFGAYPGRRDGYVPHIWLQDAASAIVVALTEPVPSGIYDIVDDEPLTRREMFDALAQAVGRKHLLLVPDLLMRPLMGTKYDDMSRSIRISNRRFKEVSNWQPTVPNAWIGWARIGQESARGDHSPAGMVR